MEGGGFHGYQKITISNSSSPATSATTATGLKLSDINVRLAEMNHQYIMQQQQQGKTITNSTNNNNNNNHASSNGSIHAGGSDDNECTVREQDRFMPIANVIRIMRKILPPHAKISDDAKETIQECVSEYISFITGEANERCQREQRKTITAEDVLWAMSKLGFDDYIEPLTLYLHRYREMEGERGSSTAPSTSLMRSDSSLQLKQLSNNTTTSNLTMMRGVDHHHRYYGIGTTTTSSLAAAAAFHQHQHSSAGHGFFGYLKPPSADASTSNNNINNNANSAAQQQHPNGDHRQQHAT